MFYGKVFSLMEKDLRVVVVDGVNWFVACDVCRMCGLGEGNRQQVAILSVPNEERIQLRDLAAASNTDVTSFYDVALKGNSQKFFSSRTWLVKESGLYRIVMRGEKDEARRFQDWVYCEVLPSLRTTGTYTIPGIAQQSQSQHAESTQLQIFNNDDDMQICRTLLMRNEASTRYGKCEITTQFIGGTPHELIAKIRAGVKILIDKFQDIA